MPVGAADPALTLGLDPAPAPAPGPAPEPWWARLSRPGRTTLVAVLSADFPPGTVVDLPGERRPSGWKIAVGSDDADGQRPRTVEVDLPGAPLLWYVELTEPDADPPATTLVAFSDARFADAELLSQDEARTAGISAAAQVGAIRWWPGTGLVHQIYVGPAHRRRGVGRKLATAAFGLQAARGLPALHGDGRRTEMGEQWRQALPEAVAARMAPWSQRLAPMTPGGS
jgi:GNAT superfamily N-acetyltransferase